MDITLKPEHEEFIQAQIADGKFTSADEVVDFALQVLEKANREYAEWVEETRAKVEVAAAELDRGEGLNGDAVIDRILDRLHRVHEMS